MAMPSAVTTLKVSFEARLEEKVHVSHRASEGRPWFPWNVNELRVLLAGEKIET